jgi:hypothetical protein
MTKKKPTRNEEIQRYGELQFSETELCEILEVDAITDEERKHYRKGQLMARAAVVKAVYTQAKQGSTPCQKEMLSLIMRCEEENRKRQRTETQKPRRKIPGPIRPAVKRRE